MSAAQAIASRRFLRAMGSMVEDEERLNEVLEYKIGRASCRERV